MAMAKIIKNTTMGRRKMFQAASNARPIPTRSAIQPPICRADAESLCRASRWPSWLACCSRSVEILLEGAHLGSLTQPVLCLLLDLTHPLTRDPEHRADLLQGLGLAIQPQIAD